MSKLLKSFDVLAETGSLARIRAGEFAEEEAFKGDLEDNEMAQAACLDLLLAVGPGTFSPKRDNLIELTCLLIAVIRTGTGEGVTLRLLRQNLAKLGLTPDIQEVHQRKLLEAFKGDGWVN